MHRVSIQTISSDVGKVASMEVLPEFGAEWRRLARAELSSPIAPRPMAKGKKRQAFQWLILH